MNESSTSPTERRNAALRAVLRAGDPAADLPALDVDRLRRRVRAERAEARQPAWRPWLPVAAVAASLAALWLVARPWTPAPPRVEPERTGVTASTGPRQTGAATGGGEVRQMQFETPGGTRIIWVMAARLD